MDEHVQQMQHPVLKIEPQTGQYAAPVLNAGVNQVYYVVMPNIPDQGNIITASGVTGANSLLQNQNAYYVINPGNTTWNQLPVIQTSTTPYVEPDISEVPIQDPLNTISYGTTVNSTDLMQGVNDFATEVVINTEPESTEQSFDSQRSQFAKPSRECDVCQKVLCNKDSLRRHKKLVHGLDETGQPELPEAAQMKRNAKQCECQFCGKVLCNRDSLRRHQKVVHKDGPGNSQPHASYIKLESSMSEQEQLEEAVRRLDEISEPDHPQQQIYYHQIATQEVSQPQPAVQKSVRRFTTTTRRKKHPICEVCRKPFYNKATLLRHWSTFHKGMTMGEIQTTGVDTNTNVTCNICHRTFFDISTLRRHKVVVHHDNSALNVNNISSTARINGKSDPCHICGKVLYDRGVLRRHLKMVHKIGDGDAQRMAHRKYAGTSPKAQKCHLCDKVLYDKGVLRRHLKHVHGLDNTEPLPSDTQVPTPVQPISTKTYVRSEIEMDRPPPLIPGLDMPVMETPKPANSSTHSCDKCEETFANASNLKRHLVIVHKMKVENYEAVLRQHTVHSKLPRDCNICGKTIIGRSNLARHQQNVHKIGPIKTEPRGNFDLGNQQQDDNNHALEQNFLLKCEPEEMVPYSQEQVDHNGATFPVESETEIAVDHVLPDNGHEMELGDGGDSKTMIAGLGEVVFDLNEVVECAAKVKQEGETDSNEATTN